MHWSVIGDWKGVVKTDVLVDTPHAMENVGTKQIQIYVEPICAYIKIM